MEDKKIESINLDTVISELTGIVRGVFRKLKEDCKKNCDQKIRDICENDPKVDICLQIAIETFEKQLEREHKKSIFEILSVSLPLILVRPEDTKSEERKIEDSVLPLARLFFEENWLLVMSILKERHGLT